MAEPVHEVPADINPAMLTWARERKGMSYSDVGTLMGLSPTLISSWETVDSTDRPTWDQAERLADILCVGIVYFLLGEGHEAASRQACAMEAGG